MSNHTITSIIINNTSSPLVVDYSETKAVLGNFQGLGNVSPHSRVTFLIEDIMTGAEAINLWSVGTKGGGKDEELERVWMHVRSRPMYGNCFKDKPIKPSAVFETTLRVKVDEGDWQAGPVPGSGHPITLEYTVNYQTKPSNFRLVKLAAKSTHAVRNSRGKLITGLHTLWASDTASEWADGEAGSFSPNVFAHNAASRVAESGHVDVTVRACNWELTDAEVIVLGSVHGKRVFQTDYFFIKNLDDRVVTANIVDPAKSSIPFAKNADVTWSMELRQSGRSVLAIGPSTTRLELYWIGKQLHQAFWNGIPVGFLRFVFRANNKGVQTRNVDQDVKAWKDATAEDVFSGCNKRYDTAAGASAFGMAVWGGIFEQAYYLAAAQGSSLPGTLYPYVNCFDQAAMLELWHSINVGDQVSSWLLQQPFGYIKTTSLVGITEPTPGQENKPRHINVNNPFFGTDWTKAHLDNNNPGRQPFFNHVFVGSNKPFNRATGYIYDSCAGPHKGTEKADAYLRASRQDTTETSLYSLNNPHMYPGQVNTIEQGAGVTGLNGQPHQPSPPASGVGFASPARRAALLTSLVGPPREASAVPIMHVDWAHVDSWVSEVLGAAWSVAFKSVTAGPGTARAFWHLVRSHGDSDTPPALAGPLRVSVVVESAVAANGRLDVPLSTAAARDRAAEILFTVDRDPEDIWAPGSAVLGRYGDYVYQYGSGLGAGRIVVVATNTVVDICGGTSTRDLAAVARPLLEWVVRRNVARRELEPPALYQGRLVPDPPPHPQLHSQYNEDSYVVRLQRAGSRVTLEFDVDKDIAAAGASSPGGKVLLDRYTAEPGSGTVRFDLVAQESGTSTIALHVTDDRTMVSATQLVTVHVE